MKFTQMIVVLAMLAAQRGQAMDYYVSGRGEDANPGTKAKPWRTIARINSAAFLPGDRILFQAGETFSGNLVLDERSKTAPKQPITIASAGKGRATLLAGDGTGLLVRNLGGIVVRDLLVQGSGHRQNRGSGVKILNALPGGRKLDFVRVERIEASGFRQEGIVVGGNPPDGSKSGYRDVRITHCIAHDNMYYGIFVNGFWDVKATAYANENVVIADCTVYNNPGDPDYKENHSGNGMVLSDVVTGRIERCVAYNNGADNGGLTGGPVGIWTHNADKVTIQFCESYGNRTGGAADGGGFDFDGGVTNSLMQYNYSHDNDGAGYLVWNYADAPHRLGNNTLRYNISENDGRKHNFYGGIHVGRDKKATPITHLHIYGNTLFVAPKAGGVSPAAIAIDGTEDVVVSDNLYLTQGGISLLTLGANVRLTVLNNAYWSSGAEFTIRDGEKSYNSLDAWRAASGQERREGKDYGLVADPQLSRVGMGETPGKAYPLRLLRSYRPLPSSPLLGAGLPTRLFSALFQGNPFSESRTGRGKSRDIGAFELSLE